MRQADSRALQLFVDHGPHRLQVFFAQLRCFAGSDTGIDGYGELHDRRRLVQHRPPAPTPVGIEWDAAAIARGEPAGVPEPGVAMIAAAAATLFTRRRRGR